MLWLLSFDIISDTTRLPYIGASSFFNKIVHMNLRNKARVSSMESISYSLIEDEDPENKISIISENTEKASYINIAEIKINLARPENREQKAPLLRLEIFTTRQRVSRKVFNKGR